MNADLTKRLQYKIDNPKSWGGSFNERSLYIELLSELLSSEAREAALREINSEMMFALKVAQAAMASDGKWQDTAKATLEALDEFEARAAQLLKDPSNG